MIDLSTVLGISNGLEIGMSKQFKTSLFVSQVQDWLLLCVFYEYAEVLMVTSSVNSV